MKKRTSLISLLMIIALTASTQVPQKFNYQAVLRDFQNGLIANQMVYFRISILEGSADGSPVYVETHSVNVNEFGLANLVIGEGTPVSGSFMEISWGENDHFLKVEVGLAGSMIFNHVGTSQLISVPYALYSGSISSPTKKFTIQEEKGHPVDSALFEVRNLEGQTVFAVYPEGTRVYVLDEETKGKKGGFSVGGYSRTTKGVTQEYMRVTPDSVRIYIEEPTAPTKGKKGGFKVGGYSRTAKGGSEYFNISTDLKAEEIPGVNRVVWYPQRNAFLAGNVLIVDADSVGENSVAAGYQSQAVGDYSEAFGYKSIAKGENATAIGNQAIAESSSSFAFGTGAIARGSHSYAIGSYEVDSEGIPVGNTISIGDWSFAIGVASRAEGEGSFSIGTVARSIGDYSFAMGFDTRATELFSTAMGFQTYSTGYGSTAIGYSTSASGPFSTALGGSTQASGAYSTAMGSSTIGRGQYSTAMGKDTEAGSYCSMALGRYNANTAGDPDSWVDTDPLFIIGNGSPGDKHNAMLVRKDGVVYFPDVYGHNVATPYRDLQISLSGEIGFASSSRRYKDNITSMEDVNWLYDLTPVNFYYKADESKTKMYGLIAEEVEDVNPLFVSYNEDGEPETVSYSQLISPMIKALQDQDKLIKELQARIEELERE